MSFLELPGIDDVVEKRPVAEGKYDLRIVDAKLNQKEDTGKMNIRNIIEIDGHPEAENIFFYLALPHADDEDDSRQFKMLQIKRFCNQFGIKIDGGIETEQFVGSVATASKVIQVEVEADYAQYAGQTKNELKLNPLPNEG